jgi:tetratricopeptide (TPR) repeat protein
MSIGEQKMSVGPADHQVKAALEALESEQATIIEKVEMLMEMAMGLQLKPKKPDQFFDAIALYDRALALCPEEEPLLAARIQARKGTALQSIPHPGPEYLHKAQAALEAALVEIHASGRAEEVAEVEMNLGLVIQNLAGMNQAPIADSIAAYQRALGVFTRDKYPAEYAILHNNLTTAFLSIPLSDERAKMREALAVQSFEEALKVINLVDQPSEYAMLQNNLGNVLQYISSSHAVENNCRALEAYDEALKVRNPKDTPIEYANTISNKANCLRNLPDDPADPEMGNRENLMKARSCYREARQLFLHFGDDAKAAIVEEALAEVERDLGTGKAGSRDGKGFGKSRI